METATTMPAHRLLFQLAKLCACAAESENRRIGESEPEAATPEEQGIGGGLGTRGKESEQTQQINSWQFVEPSSITRRQCETAQLQQQQQKQQQLQSTAATYGERT